MKTTYTLAVLAVFVTAAEAAWGAELTSDEQKFSYAVGFQIGQNLSREGLELDGEALSQAIKDAMSGAEPKITPEEMRAAVEQYRQRAADELAAQAEANLKASQEFMAANKGKPGVTETASGLQYKVLTEGSGGKQPSATDTVVVHYRGTLPNGDEFDSSYSREQPATLPLNGVIKGWQEALPLMSEGAKWELYIPAELAYGERGAGSRIGPNQALVFEVELLEVK